MRTIVAAAVACLSLAGLSVAADVQASIKKSISIPAGGLGPALHMLSEERDIHVVFISEDVNKLSTEGARGDLTVDEVLNQLLSGTGLTYQYIDAKTVSILPVAPAPAGSTTSSALSPKRSVWSRIRMAQASSSAPSGGEVSRRGDEDKNSSGDRSSQEDRSIKIEEIIVTAQKREERLIDVPQSVTVLSAEGLAKLGATQFRDFANTIPGLSFTTAGAGNTQISLRGVTAGFDFASTVGIYIDEVPYASSNGFAGGSQLALDVGLFDLHRIEILRGPQGTLYGASAMGGLIKYVTKRPDATSFGVNAQTGISSTREGGISYHGAATVNAPIITDKAAVRATAFYSHDGGYIDNLALGREDVNRSNIHGGRADVLLTPTDALSIRITGFAQDISRDGEGRPDYSSAGLLLDGDLDQRRPYAEPFDQRFRLVSGTVTYDLESATLTSISSYQTVRSEFNNDLSAAYVPLLTTIGQPTYGSVGVRNPLGTDKFVQEVRLASEEVKRLDWLLGAFYTYEDSENQQEFVLRTPAGQPAPNNLLTVSIPSRFEEYAAFGDVTWRLSDTFDVTGGVRYARNSQTFEQIRSGILVGPSTPERRSTGSVSTYLANARYHFSDHATGYLRYATGYRPGGPNYAARDATTGLPVGPESYESDELKSYELGFKAESSDRRFEIDFGIYYIDWSNIQVSISRGGFSGRTNAAGGASVRGAELTLTARPTSGFSVTGAFAYQDAQLSETDTDLRAGKGERLPNVPRFTAALNADYDLPLGNLRPTVGATLRQVDERRTGFGATAYDLPDYTTVDLRTGLTLERFALQLYLRNIFDERGQLSAALLPGIVRPAILQPRTIGISVTTSF